MLQYLMIGTLLGLSAGLAPGPLLTLLISETMRHDIKAGVKIAMAPLISDLPIVLLTFYILSQLTDFEKILGGISFAGGILVLTMGIGQIRTKGVEIDTTQVKSHSLVKGVVVNFLSPHPYLFWLSVGAPTMTKARDISVFAAIAFVVSFYVLLIGSKVVMALLVGKSKGILKGKGYLYTMRFLGFLLCLLALLLFKDGWSLWLGD